MGEMVNAYKRLPEHTSVPELAWEIDSLIEQSEALHAELIKLDEEIYQKQMTYFSYLRKHWTQEEIIRANKGRDRQ